MAFKQALTQDKTSDNSVTFDVTGLVSAGDVLIFYSFWDNNNFPSPTTPSGFVSVAEITNSIDESSSMNVFIKGNASGSETTLTFTYSVFNFTAGLLIFDGVDTTTPQDVTRVVSQGTGMDDSPWNQSATIVPVTNGAILVVIYGSDSNNSCAPTYSFSGGSLTWTTVGTVAGDTWYPLTAAYATQSTAGSITITGTGTAASRSAVPQMVVMALRPSGGAAAVSLPAHMTNPQRAFAHLLPR